MKYIILALAVLTLSMGARAPIKKPVQEVPQRPVEIQVSTPEKKPFLTIGKCTNCTVEEWKFIKAAEIKTNETVASTCYASFMLQRALIQTGGRSNQQVVEHIQSAEVKIDVEMYYSLKRVLGYTYPKVKKEWINRRYMLSWNKCDLGSLLGHETDHKIGYEHDFNYNDQRKFSVPYSTNEAIDKCCVRH